MARIGRWAAYGVVGYLAASVLFLVVELASGGSSWGRFAVDMAFTGGLLVLVLALNELVRRRGSKPE